MTTDENPPVIVERVRARCDENTGVYFPDARTRIELYLWSDGLVTWKGTRETTTH